MSASATVDHDLCAGVGQCLIEAPGAFSFDEDGMSVFTGHGDWTPVQVERAVASCPMGAITETDD